MSGSRPTWTISDAHAEIHAEHSHLAELTARIEAASSTATLANHLGDLQEMLKSHFAREEYPGGLYDQMGATSGEHRTAVRKLIDEHFMLMGAVRGLRGRLELAEPDAFDDMASEARGILWMLGAHENRENDLVRATTRD